MTLRKILQVWVWGTGGRKPGIEWKWKTAVKEAKIHLDCSTDDDNDELIILHCVSFQSFIIENNLSNYARKILEHKGCNIILILRKLSLKFCNVHYDPCCSISCTTVLQHLLDMQKYPLCIKCKIVLSMQICTQLSFYETSLKPFLF